MVRSGGVAGGGGRGFVVAVVVSGAGGGWDGSMVLHVALVSSLHNRDTNASVAFMKQST